MSLALDAIERAGSGDKADILKALFETKDRESVLGKYSIDENGDTSLTDYGVYKIEDGELKFDKSVKAQPDLSIRWGGPVWSVPPEYSGPT